MLAIALDTATQKSSRQRLAAVKSAKLWINIDHHPSNPRYGDLVCIDPTAPATGQILFELLKARNCRSTARLQKIFSSRFQPIPVRFNIRIRPHALLRSQANSCVAGRRRPGEPATLPKLSAPADRVTARASRHDAFRRRRESGELQLQLAAAAELGAQPEDNEGLIDHLRAIEGVIVAVFFEELADGKVRVSLRSKNEAADVCAICQKFRRRSHPCGRRACAGTWRMSEKA